MTIDFFSRLNFHKLNGLTLWSCKVCFEIFYFSLFLMLFYSLKTESHSLITGANSFRRICKINCLLF